MCIKHKYIIDFYYKIYTFIIKNTDFILLPLSCANNSLGREDGKVGTLIINRISVFLNPIPFHHKFIQSIIQSPHFTEEVNLLAKGHLGQLWTNFTIRCSFYIYHTLLIDSSQFLIRYIFALSHLNDCQRTIYA